MPYDGGRRPREKNAGTVKRSARRVRAKEPRIERHPRDDQGLEIEVEPGHHVDVVHAPGAEVLPRLDEEPDRERVRLRVILRAHAPEHALD